MMRAGKKDCLFSSIKKSLSMHLRLLMLQSRVVKNKTVNAQHHYFYSDSF